MTRTGAAAQPPLQERAETLFESLRENSRAAIIAVVAIAAVAGGIALYGRSKEAEAVRAEQALSEAQRAADAGNLPAAQTALSRVAGRYDGTPAANRANLVLAQVMYDQGKYAEGLAVLAKVEGDVDDATKPTVYALRAAGHEQMGKHAEAAASYLKAAETSEFELDKANYQANAARAYMVAGNKAAAQRLWTALAADPRGPIAGEARVRLGELTAVPAGKS